MKRAVTILVALLVLALVGAGLLNVLADNAPIRELARLRACATLADRIRADAKAIRGKEAEVEIPACELALRREGKDFFGQTYDFVGTLHQGHAGDAVQIRCARSAIFVGDYSCQPQ